MDTTLSEEEVMIRESARKFLETHCPTKLVREMEKDAKGFPPALWRQAAELGWQGLALPEQYGGSAMPLTYLGLVLEEVGRALAPLPLHSTVVAALTIASDANEELATVRPRSNYQSFHFDDCLGSLCAGFASAPQRRCFTPGCYRSA